MGYGVMPYRVKTDTIAELFGSKKELASDNITVRSAQLDDNFETEYGWASTQELLDQYLQGDDAFLSYEYSFSKHWYVIEMLIMENGQMLANGDWYPGGNIDPFYKIDVFNMGALDRGKKIALMRPVDFPAVFVVYNEDLDEAASHADQIEDEGQRKQFLDWTDTAKKHEDDLVLFYY